MNEENYSDKKIKRIDAKYISHEIQHIFHIEKGYLYTITQLLKKPGKTVREYLYENREKYVKPIVYLVFSGVLLTLYLHFFHIEFIFMSLNNFEYFHTLEKKFDAENINEWSDGHIGYSALIIGIFISLWVKVFFFKREYNIFEIIVLMSYCFGTLFILMLLFTALAIPLKINLIAQLGTIISQIYIVWSIGQFFGEKKILNYFKALICYFLGIMSYKFAILLIAYLIP
ncbi:DUF3667 domain-containing protein [Flavobacterium sp. GT2P42]